MKFEIIKKHLWIILLSCALLLISFFAIRSFDNDRAPFSVIIDANGKTETIKAWKDTGAGIYYYFLPSYSSESNARISVNHQMSLYVDDVELSDNSLVGDFFEYDEEYQIIGSGLWPIKYHVSFYKADNVSTVYVNTATGSMREVFKDKSHKEPASIAVFTQNGEIDKLDNDITINGRGNTTWGEDKKPFTLKFTEEQSLLGMQASSSWILLANARDKSNIKNKMVFDLANKVGLPYTSESEFVSFYLNGEYYGLFLLCQSVNSVGERIGDVQNTVLCKFEFYDRAKFIENGKKIGPNEMLVEFSRPKNLSGDDREACVNKILRADDSVLDYSNVSKDLSKAIDIDSWAKRFLIDEIFENYDAGVASSYFFWNKGSEDNLIVAGPVWDYDNCLGYISEAIKNPAILFSVHEYRSSNQKRYWYSELYNNNDFNQYVMRLYREYFSEEILYLENEYIPSLLNKISSAVACDKIRWNYKSDDFIKEMMEYLKVRKTFLDSIWLNGDRYCVVRYIGNDEDDYKYIYVPYGATIYDSIYVSSVFTNDKYSVFEEESGKRFDLSQKIYNDINLRIREQKEGIIPTLMFELREKKYLMVPVTVLLMMIISLVILVRERIMGDQNGRRK